MSRSIPVRFRVTSERSTVPTAAAEAAAAAARLPIFFLRFLFVWLVLFPDLDSPSGITELPVLQC